MLSVALQVSYVFVMVGALRLHHCVLSLRVTGHDQQLATFLIPGLKLIVSALSSRPRLTSAERVCMHHTGVRE